MHARAVAIVVALFAAARAFCSEGDAALGHFEAAREAFERDDLETALREFEAARAAGLSGPAVHYNIGVAAYGLGRYDAAERAFQHVALVPEMAALAHYNLGLVALRRGEAGEAARFFRLAARDATEPELRDLANAQLSRLPPAQSEQRVFRFGSLAVGYDTNVALVADADLIDPSGVEDAFVQGQFAVTGPLDRPFQFEAAALHTNYSELDEYDELTIGAGVRYRRSGGRWRHEIGVNAAYATLDADGFEARGTLALQTRRELATAWTAAARYQLSEVDGLDAFDGLSGTRQHWGVSAERRAGRIVTRIEYAYERSDLEDSLLSSDRHLLATELRGTVPGGWEVASNASYRRATYGETGASRNEHQGIVALEVARPLRDYWRLFVRAEYLSNESSDSQFDFDRSRGSLGLSALW